MRPFYGGRPAEAAGGFVLAAIACYVLYLRVWYMNMPFERDEGEYAYTAMTMLHGNLPYVKAYTMKLPGAAMIYAILIKLFGHLVLSVRLGALIFNFAAAFMLYVLVKGRFSPAAAVVCSGTWLLSSASYSALGLTANAEQFQMFFIAAGLLAADRGVQKGGMGLIFLSGLLFGLALLVKQHAVWFILFTFAFLAAAGRKKALLWDGVFAAGAALPLAVLVLVLGMGGAIDRFVFWTFTYAGKYVTAVDLPTAVKLLANRFNHTWPFHALFMIASLAGLAVAFVREGRPGNRGYALWLGAASLAAFSTGLYFREHYLLYLLPAMGIFAGTALSYFLETGIKRAEWLYPVLFLSVFIWNVSTEGKLIAGGRPEHLSRFYYMDNPFPECPRAAAAVAKVTGPDDTVAVFGSEPELYFYADRMAATSYMYMYPMMETQPYASMMQDEMIAQVESAAPRAIALFNFQKSWYSTRASEMKLFNWMERYLIKNYTAVYGLEKDAQGRYAEYGPGQVADFKKPGLITVFVRNGPAGGPAGRPQAGGEK